jgi:predicted 3-demethylubiquinone-9 3-methyltransferase (glyoxalase superfamily)
MIHSITPFLWFDQNAEEAARFYASVFKEASIDSVSPMAVTFTLHGQKFYGLNGGPQYAFTPAVSFFVSVDTQAEVDELWSALTVNGGEPGHCGWLKDRFGVSWQIIPTAFGELMNDDDDEKSGRVVQAMLQMDKIDIEGLRRAYEA